MKVDSGKEEDEEKCVVVAVGDKSLAERREGKKTEKKPEQEIEAKMAGRLEWMHDLILKENVEVVILAPQTDRRASRRCASASDF